MRSTNQTFDNLIEESADLHADAMRETNSGLADVVERTREIRPSGTSDHPSRTSVDPDEERIYRQDRSAALGAGLAASAAVAGAGFVTAMFDWLSSPAAAAGMDVQAAQTAASIENLAIAVYKKAAGLPFMKNIPNPAGATVTAFVTKTVQQHTDHAGAFNAAAKALGGKAQTGVDSVLMSKVVNPALPTLTSPLAVVMFAADLEYVAAQTYAAETAAVSDKTLRGAFSSIMGVENQHRAILLAVAALLKNNLADQIKIPPDAGALPAATAMAAFPDSFLPLNQARPATEGAL